MLHTNCEQFVAQMDAGVHDIKLHFSLSDQSADYTVQDSEYEPGAKIMCRFGCGSIGWTRRQPTTTPTSQPVITAKWLDADGNAHQGHL